MKECDRIGTPNKLVHCNRLSNQTIFELPNCYNDLHVASESESINRSFLSGNDGLPVQLYEQNFEVPLSYNFRVRGNVRQSTYWKNKMNSLSTNKPEEN